ncbi:MAG TPA: hypothetical protein VFB04_14460 [Terriglobales bacterium]|nr:hypothetical protein [Terriglobales bacterium]
MPALTSAVTERFSSAPALLYVVIGAVVSIILIALFRKDFVKACVWCRFFGFSIEAGNSNVT